MLRLEQSSRRFLVELLLRYYSQRPLKEPRFLPKREVAVQLVGASGYVRHLSFPSMSMLYNYILSKPPLHLYYSSAIYENPSAEDMESKGWLGSDLIFDIDSDHYPGCNEVIRICSRCGNIVSEGNECPKCGSELVKISPVNKECLLRAWNDVLKIIDVMEKDFGAREYEVLFSGHRGFHIRFEDSFLRDLGRDERRLIVDYLSLKNLSLDKIFIPSGRGRRKNKVLFFKRGEYGFRSRLLDTLLKVAEYRDLGDVIEASYDDVEKLALLWKVEVDPVVTMDVSRLSRFTGSINGKAGLATCPLDPDKEFEFDFSMFKVFRGTVVINPRVSLPKVTIFGENVELRPGEKIRVDATIAFYLASRGLVYVVDDSNVEVAKPCT